MFNTDEFVKKALDSGMKLGRKELALKIQSIITLADNFPLISQHIVIDDIEELIKKYLDE